MPDSRPAVMAILNCTPDSFFDGGRYVGVEAACRRAWQVAREGADLLDVGGQSTRPGAPPVSAAEEMERVLPVLEALQNGPEPYPIPISIDTARAAVAEAALSRGAVVVNDITAGTEDPELLHLVGEQGAGLVLMHIRGTPRTMQANVNYEDLFGEVRDVLQRCCARATAAGVAEAAQAVDPGIGFGKSAQGCLQLLTGLHHLASLERPLLVGASRKSFLGRCFGHEGDDRLAGSLVVAAHAVQQGASIVRAHDVRQTRLAVDVAAGLRDARSGGATSA